MITVEIQVGNGKKAILAWHLSAFLFLPSFPVYFHFRLDNLNLKIE